MIYGDICNAFYISEEESKKNIVEFGLKSVTSQQGIAERIITLGWSDESTEGVLPDNISTYNKWFYGKTGQKPAVWKRFQKDYREEKYVKLLEDDINDDVLPLIAKKLNIIIPRGKQVNKHMLATAVARQMCEFAKSKKTKNESDSIFSEVYFASQIQTEFSRYIDKASERYNVMKLIGGDEVPLDKFFVCNTIGQKERVFADKSRIKSGYLENPSMRKLRDMFSKRGLDNLHTLLIGSGGCGKSLMLQHLFLTSAAEYQNTGILPIFLELRHFKQSNEILQYIVDTVTATGESFTEEDANSLLLAGKCQLLLDGFDEIDPSDINTFLQKLKTFVTKYDKVQIVITSRQNDSLTGINQFMKLYVWPFEEKQSLELIDRILIYQGETGARDTVLEYINNGFLKKDGVFVSHPLLLTYVTMKYPQYSRFNADPSLFYKVTFEALVSGHDDNKKPYDRVFMSVDNAEQFTTVFKEFCALTYKDGVLELDGRTFEEYFNQLKSYKEFENPHKMNLKNFKHDVCSTACIMYEKEFDIFYIDPGFQECLFAEYYSQAPEDEVIKLLQSLETTPYIKLARFEALDMLCKLSRDKFRYKVLLPFLDEIFKPKDNLEAFTKFLYTCFDDVTVVDINEAAQYLVMNSLNVLDVLYPQKENYSRTILLNYILRDMGENPDFGFSMYAKDCSVKNGEMKILELPEDVEITGMVIGQDTKVEEKRYLLMDSKPIKAYEYFLKEHKNGKQDAYLVDENKDLIKLGKQINIEGYYLMTEPEKYNGVIQNVSENSEKTYSMFLRLNEYYKRLKIEKHRSGLD
ncbi:hypothetical protein MOB1_20600 [Faecalimonas mobilis]